MARDKNTFEKHRREMEKKRKAEEKRQRRLKRKEEANRPPVEPEELVPEEVDGDADAAFQIGQIRRIVGINLLLGLLVISIAAAGPYF